MKYFTKKLKDLVSIVSLGWNWFESFKILFICLSISFLWKISPRDISAKVSIKCLDKKLDIYITSYSDLLSLLEVFVQKEYELNDLTNPETIVDVGANVGFSSLYLATKYPNARIFCVEPDLRTFEKLQRNIKKHNLLKAINVGIADKDGEHIFYSSQHNSLASSFSLSGFGLNEYKVQTKTLSSFVNKYQLSSIDLLCFDIEGSEVDLIKHLGDIPIKVLMGEIHLDLIKEDLQWFEDNLRNYEVDFESIEHSRFMLKAILKTHA